VSALFRDQQKALIEVHVNLDASKLTATYPPPAEPLCRHPSFEVRPASLHKSPAHALNTNRPHMH